MVRFQQLLIILLCTIAVHPLFAQFIRPATQGALPKVNGQKTVKILAVMVEFAPDKDGVTVGDGTFNSIYSKDKDWGPWILDPLPHDTRYFENHLLYAKNYFAKNSNGLLDVQYTVLPTVITLKQTMKNYSPPINSTDFSPIAEMMTEVWTKVDTLSYDVDFSQYDLFTIFHAGVGRDVTLPGSLGNERDIPSVYMGLPALQKVYGNTFSGILVDSGRTRITNSMILPQTQNREGESFGTKYLVELTFNGLVVSNIASHLGLPDLFNTKTGISAIGLFGLMDGQAIFAYNGALNPQPSAWEKMQLGWITPKELKPLENQRAKVVTPVTALAGDTVVLKVPINSQEYYLVENRQRDAKKNGVEVTVYSQGEYKKIRFEKDTTGFYSYSADSLYGVIVDVDEYDWVVPGSGLVIWHIDDKVIKENWTAINNDKDHRGVDVEEADGIEDIGNQFTSVLGDVITGEGSEEDLWYSGNKGKFYTNVFSNNTRPDTKSNTGASSLITFSDFSSASNEMYCNIAYGTDLIKPVSSIKVQKPFTLTNCSVSKVESTDELLVQISDTLFLIKNNAISQAVPGFSEIPVISTGLYTVGRHDSTVSVHAGGNVVGITNWAKITSPLSASKFNNANCILYGDAWGYVKILNVSAPVIHDSAVQIGNQPVTHVNVFSNTFNCIMQDTSKHKSVFVNEDLSKLNLYGKVIDLKTFTNSRLVRYTFVLTEEQIVYVVSGGRVINEFTIQHSVKNLQVLDIRQDDTPCMLYIADSKIYAYNITGASADYFPVTIGTANTNSSIQGYYDTVNKEYYLVVNTELGLQILAARTGRILSGYPVSFSNSTSKTYLQTFQNKLSITAFDSTGVFSIWQLSDVSHPIVLSGLGNIGNTNGSVFVSPVKSDIGFLTAEKTYNYPNPVKTGKTFIRYDVQENAKVVVKIFDLSGDYVAELSANGTGGIDNEIAWDITSVQSGIYLAHIEATTDSGKKANRVIKIAVVK